MITRTYLLEPLHPTHRQRRWKAESQMKLRVICVTFKKSQKCIYLTGGIVPQWCVRRSSRALRWVLRLALSACDVHITCALWAHSQWPSHSEQSTHVGLAARSFSRLEIVSTCWHRPRDRARCSRVCGIGMEIFQVCGRLYWWGVILDYLVQFFTQDVSEC